MRAKTVSAKLLLALSAALSTLVGCTAKVTTEPVPIVVEESPAPIVKEKETTIIEKQTPPVVKEETTIIKK